MISFPPVALPEKGASCPETLSASSLKIKKAIHKTIAFVTDDLENFHFNKAVARIRELTNLLAECDAKDPASPWILRFGLETILRLLNPIAPHVTEEGWALLGYDTALVETAWPIAETEFLQEDTVTLAVQVNGKLRATLEVSIHADKAEIEGQALQLPALQNFIEGKEIKKIILVPGKIINVVV